MNATKHSQGALDLIKSSEGCKLVSYADTNGKPTIGWGATFYQDGNLVKLGQTITQEQADALLDWHLAKADAQVLKEVKQPLNQNQFDALVDFDYNCGQGNLDSSTLLKEVNKNPNDPDIAIQFKRWVHDEHGKEQGGLVTRRAKEAALYFKPI